MHKFPVPKSKLITGLEWLGERIPYPEPTIKGDTFPMTWGADGEIYTSAGDPIWCGEDDGLDAEKFLGTPPDYKIVRTSNMRDYQGWGGWGAKPSGMISVSGVLYLAVQNMLGYKPPARGGESQHGSDAVIVLSIDKGITWRPTIKEMKEYPDKGIMFPGYEFGGPAFVNYGRDNAGAVDEFVYAVSGDQWDNGSELRCGRVHAERIMHPSDWQWVAGFDRGKPRWTSNLDESVPVLCDPRWIGLPEMVYLASVKRYLLLTWRLHADFAGSSGTDLVVYESPNPWGPFSWVFFDEYWQGKEVNPYCPRVPLKWMEPDGLTGWMQHSGSWGPNSPYYRSNVRKFRLKLK